ncbi:MAG TPA: hypothetical protein VFB36_13000 [Nevskiaceae bacterium]|nr:hypothetical protein [Nevskiaceae bacterium]
MNKSILIAMALALAACGTSAPPQPPAPELEALAKLIEKGGTPGVTPPHICQALGVRVCDQPTVKSLMVMQGDHAKFAQVYLKSPEDLSLGIRRQDDAIVFRTDVHGRLLANLKLDKSGIGKELPAADAQELFNEEKGFWLHWLAMREAAKARAAKPK